MSREEAAVVLLDNLLGFKSSLSRYLQALDSLDADDQYRLQNAAGAWRKESPNLNT